MVPFQSVPTDQAAFLALKSHYLRIQDYRALAQLLESWAERLIDAPTAADIYLEVGDLFIEKLDNKEKAIEMYRAALGKNPLLLKASERLENLFRADNDLVHLLATLEQRAHALSEPHAAELSSPRARAELHFTIGQMIEQTLGQAQAALQHYQYGVQIDSSYTPNIEAARIFLLATGQIELATQYYELIIQAEGEARRASLLVELSRLYADVVGAKDRALQTLGKLSLCATDMQTLYDAAVTALQWSHQIADSSTQNMALKTAADLFVRASEFADTSTALAWVESALDAWPSHLQGLALLERLCLHTEPLRVHARWAAFLSHQAKPSRASRVIRVRLAQAYLANDQVEDAEICLAPLLSGSPEQRKDVLEPLFELTATLRMQDIAKHLLLEFLQPLTVEQRLAWLRNRLTTLEPGSTSHTLAAEQTLLADPTDLNAHAALETAYRASGEAFFLRNLLMSRAQLPSSSTAQKKEWLMEAAMLSHDVLNDVEGSLSAWKQLVTMDPTDDTATDRLGELLMRMHRWDEAVQVLERRIQSIDAQRDNHEHAATLWLRIAKIHCEHRNDKPSAARAVMALLEAPPRDAALLDEASRILVDSGDIDRAIEILERHLSVAQPSESPGSIMRLLARLLVESGADDTRAYHLCQQILDDDAGDTETIDLMLKLDIKHGRSEAIMQGLIRRSQCVSGEARATTLEQIADRLATDPTRISDAGRYYVQSMEAHPDIQKLIEKAWALYTTDNERLSFVDQLEIWAASESNTGILMCIYRMLGEFLGRMPDQEKKKLGALEKLVSINPSDISAWDALVNILRADASGAQNPLMAEGLLRMFSMEEDGVRKRGLGLDLARTWIGLGEDLRACQLLKDLIGQETELDSQLFSLLAESQERLEDYDGLAVTLEWLLQCSLEPVQRLQAVEKLCELYQYRLGDSLRAMRFLRAWADLAPQSPEPWRRLMVLLDASHQYHDLIDCLNALVERESDPKTVVSLNIRAAELEAGTLQQPELAWHRLCRAQRSTHDERYDGALRQLANATERLPALATFYLNTAHDCQEASHAINNLKRAAELFAMALDQPEQALECWVEVLSWDPDNEEALDQVDHLAQKHTLWERSCTVYETLIAHQSDPPKKRALMLRQVQKLRAHSRNQEAFEVILRHLHEYPNFDDLIEEAKTLAPILRREEDLFSVFDAYQKSLTEPEAILKTILEAASLAFGIDRSAERTALILAEGTALCIKHRALFEFFEAEVLRWVPASPGPDAKADTRSSLNELIVVYRSLGNDAQIDPAARSVVLERAAHLLETQANNPSTAAHVLLDAARLNADDVAITDRWYQLASRLKLWEDIEQGLADLASHASDKNQAGRLHAMRADTILQAPALCPEPTRVAAELFRKAYQVSKDLSYRARYREVLRTLDSQASANALLLDLTEDTQPSAPRHHQLAAWREIAQLWEHRLSNLREALEAWKQVHVLDPKDDHAPTHIERLSQEIHQRDPDSTLTKLADS